MSAAIELPRQIMHLAVVVLAIASTPLPAFGFPVDVPLSLQRNFSRARFFTMDKGYVFGLQDPTAIIATEDGGVTWRLVKDGTFKAWGMVVPGRRHLQLVDVVFPDPEQFWILTDDCEVVRTSDGGRTFESKRIMYNLEGETVAHRVCGGISAVSGDRAWVAGARRILRTEDGGRTWDSEPVPQGLRTVWDVWMFDDAEGIVTGEPGAARTEDGGKTWLPVANAPDFGSEDLHCAADGFCAVMQGFFGPLFVSSDRGRTWRELAVPLKPGGQDKIRTVDVLPSRQIILVGVDAGINYEEADRELARTGSNVFPTHAPAQGLILKWDGSAWTRITHAVPQNFAGAYFLDWENGWLFTYRYGIYKTTDGGRTIELVPDYFRQLFAPTATAIAIEEETAIAGATATAAAAEAQRTPTP